MVVHLGPVVPCSVSTTPNIAPAAAPPARTGASDLNPNALAFVDSVHGQVDDGSQKVRYILPQLENSPARPPQLPLHTCLDPQEAARSPFTISNSRTLVGRMRRFDQRGPPCNGHSDAAPRRWDPELRREPSTGDASAPPGPRRWDESGLGAPAGRPSFGHQGSNSGGRGGRSDWSKRYVA